MSTLRYEGIIFDLDGTLVDSYDALLHAVNIMLGEEGAAAVDRETLRTYVGEGVERLLERCFAGSIPPSAPARFEAEYEKVCRSKSFLLDEVEQTLRILGSLGVSMGVCTNKPTGFSVAILDALGVASYFEAVVGPDTAGVRKPDGRHVEYVLRAIGTPRDRTLFVGDMPIDVAAARNAAVDVATIATGSSARQALLDSDPDYHLKNFSELLSIVKGDL